MRVYVYYNLHKKCWSVRHRGKVVAHVDTIVLTDCRLKVSESGRQRVIREGKKNVHAGVEGIWRKTPTLMEITNSYTYNPYKYSSFVNRETGTPIHTADKLYLHEGKVYGSM